MKTEITELLNIEYPIIQGGMAWVADYHLAAAVSNAGGLGLIGSGGAPASWVKDQIREVKKLTDKPFGVNIMLMNPEADEIAKVIVEEKVPVVTTGAGNPAKYIGTTQEYIDRNMKYNLHCKGMTKEEKKKFLLSLPDEKFIRK